LIWIYEVDSTIETFTSDLNLRVHKDNDLAMINNNIETQNNNSSFSINHTQINNDSKEIMNSSKEESINEINS